MSNDLDPSLDLYVKAVLGKKAFGVLVLDVQELTSISDVFIICSGHSNRQVTSISEFIRTELKKHDKTPLSVEGEKEGHWVLLDYGHVIIHVFYDPIRNFYDLEGLWTDAKRIKTESLDNYELTDDLHSSDWESEEEEEVETEVL
ncbi:MAG: ribosome silencing factor [Desulfobacteraceae bacterium 4572_88]|nr:MAG: ribosome silencing factor [Desulfobacteraceae bacterium 4572_88]